MTLFIKVDLTIFIRFRLTCDNRLLVHQNKELQRALIRACVRVCVRACMGGCVCVRTYVHVRTVIARGRLKLMMTAATFMRGVLDKEAIS